MIIVKFRFVAVAAADTIGSCLHAAEGPFDLGANRFYLVRGATVRGVQQFQQRLRPADVLAPMNVSAQVHVRLVSHRGGYFLERQSEERQQRPRSVDFRNALTKTLSAIVAAAAVRNNRERDASESV